MRNNPYAIGVPAHNVTAPYHSAQESKAYHNVTGGIVQRTQSTDQNDLDGLMIRIGQRLKSTARRLPSGQRRHARAMRKFALEISRC